MPQSVDIKGVGIVSFPDEYTPEQIKTAIETDILPQFNQQPTPAAQGGEVNPPGTMVGRALKKAVTQPFTGAADTLAQTGQSLATLGRSIGEGGLGLATGATQLGTEGLQAIGVPIPQEFTQALERQAANLKPKGTFETVGQAIPLFAAGPGFKTATSVLRGLGVGAQTAGVGAVPISGAVIGGGTGALQPTAEGESRVENIQTGAGLGALGSSVFTGLFALGSAGIKTAKQLWVGLDQKVANNLAEYLTPEQVAILKSDQTPAVPGTTLTTAETLEMAGAPSVGLRQAQEAVGLTPEQIRTQQGIFQQSQQAVRDFEQQQATGILSGKTGAAAEQVAQKASQEIDVADNALRQFDQDQQARIALQNNENQRIALQFNMADAEANLAFNAKMQASQNKINGLQDELSALETNQLLSESEKQASRLRIFEQIKTEENVLNSITQTANDVAQNIQRINPLEAGAQARESVQKSFTEANNEMKRVAENLGINEDLDKIVTGNDVAVAVRNAFESRGMKNVQDISPFEETVAVVNQFVGKPYLSFNDFQILTRLVNQDIASLQKAGKTEQKGLLRAVSVELQNTFQKKGDDLFSGAGEQLPTIAGGYAEQFTPDVLNNLRKGKAKGATIRKKPESLSAWLIKQGGINNQNETFRGEIQYILGRAKDRPGLINNKRGKALDELARAAQEAGFFPQKQIGDDVEPDELLEALQRDLSGNRVYRPDDVNAKAYEDSLANRQQEDGIDAFFSQNNIDLAKDSNEQIAEKLRRIDVENNPQAAADTAQKRTEQGIEFKEKQKNWKAFQESWKRNIVDPFYNETTRPLVGLGKEVNDEDIVKRFLSPNNLTEAKRLAVLSQNNPELTLVAKKYLEDSLAQASTKNGEFDLKGYDKWFKQWNRVLNELPEGIKLGIDVVDERMSGLISDMAQSQKSIDDLRVSLGDDITRAQEQIANLDDKIAKNQIQSNITGIQRETTSRNLNKAKDLFIRKRDEAERKLSLLDQPEDILNRVAQRNAIERQIKENQALKNVLNASSQGKLTAPMVAVSNAIKSPQAFERLYEIAKTDRNALNALKRSMWDSVTVLKPDDMINFMEANEKNLAKLLSTEHLKALKDISDYNRILAGRKLRLAGSDFSMHTADIGLTQTATGFFQRKFIRKLVALVDSKQSETWQKALYDKDFAVKLLNEAKAFDSKTPAQKEKTLANLNKFAAIATVNMMQE